MVPLNLKRKRKLKSFLPFRRQDKSVHVSRQVNLNYRLTNRQYKATLLKLLTRCKDKEYRVHKTLPQWLGRRKHQSYSIPHSAAQAVAKQTV